MSRTAVPIPLEIVKKLEEQNEDYAWLNNALPTVKPVDGTLTVLEVGCGANPISYLMCLHYCNAHSLALDYTAVDIDAKAVEGYSSHFEEDLKAVSRPKLQVEDAKNLPQMLAHMKARRADLVVMCNPIVEDPKMMPAYQLYLQKCKWQASLSAVGRKDRAVDREVLRLKQSMERLQKQYDGSQLFFKNVLPSLIAAQGVLAAKLFHPEEFAIFSAQAKDFYGFAVAPDAATQSVTLQRDPVLVHDALLDKVKLPDLEGAHLATAIRRIAASGSLQELAMLLSLPGVEINAVDAGGKKRAALHWAYASTTSDWASKVKLLEAYGADPTLKDTNGKAAKTLGLEKIQASHLSATAKGKATSAEVEGGKVEEAAAAGVGSAASSQRKK